MDIDTLFLKDRNYQKSKNSILKNSENLRYVIPIITEDQLRTHEAIRFYYDETKDLYHSPYLANTVSINQYDEFSNIDNYQHLTPLNLLSESDIYKIKTDLVFDEIPYQYMMDENLYIKLCRESEFHTCFYQKKKREYKIKHCFSTMTKDEYIDLCNISGIKKYINHKCLSRTDWF